MTPLKTNFLIVHALTFYLCEFFHIWQYVYIDTTKMYRYTGIRDGVNKKRIDF